MDHVPAEEEQRWLLMHLGEVIAYAGRRRFLESPIIEPTDEFFPDRWTPGPKGVTRLAKRILGHAGMGAFGVELELFTDETMPVFDERGRVFSERHLGDAAAWFMSLDGGRCHFGVETGNLAAPKSLAAILCHEVAHAFRDWKGLAYEARHEDEPLTDLTTVYLGFGILTTNLSYQFRSSQAGGWAHTRGGYLSPVELSFLLAAQCVARSSDAATRRRIARHLETNQAAFFQASLAHLDADAGDLRRTLGLEGAPAVHQARKAFNLGLPVHRVKGGWFRAARCSDPDCGEKLGASMTACPGCGGTILGEVASAEEARRSEAALSDEESAAADAILSFIKKD